jgi:hypothetical protein
MLGVTLKGNPKSPEPTYFRVKLPGGEVCITRTKDNGYWVHVNVEDGHDAAPGSDRQLGVFADARLDRRSQHAGDVDLGDFGADDLNHVAFRIAPKSS